MKSPFPPRRDLIYLFLLVPLGILLMLVSGQLGIRLMSNWSVRADISSHVDTGTYFESSVFPNSVAPVRSDILTPMAWMDSFLNPQTNSDAAVVPLVVLNPSATPTNTPVVSPTASPTSVPPTVTATPSPSPSPSPSASPPPTSVTPTKKPKDPPDDPPTPTATASPTLPPVTSTIDPALTQLAGTPPGLNTGNPDGSNASGNNFPDGSYFVMDHSSSPIIVNATPDGAYDLIYYEDENPDGSGVISMDQVIIGISNDPSGATYYQVFNWGDGVPDANSNVDTTVLGVPAAEVDNQTIQTNDLYEDPAATPPPSNSQVGILIDVDQAESHPPPGSYQFLVIIAPPASSPNNSGDDGQVDSVEVAEVTSPAPP